MFTKEKKILSSFLKAFLTFIGFLVGLTVLKIVFKFLHTFIRELIVKTNFPIQDVGTIDTIIITSILIGGVVFILECYKHNN